MQFGRTTVILTSGAGNVGSEPRSMYQIARRATRAGKCAVLLYIYIYIYVYIYEKITSVAHFWYMFANSCRIVVVFDARA